MLHHISTPNNFYSQCDEVSKLSPKYILEKKFCEEDPHVRCPEETDSGNCASVGHSTLINGSTWVKPATADKQSVYSFVHGPKYDAYVVAF